jgi:hypothetical protein
MQHKGVPGAKLDPTRDRISRRWNWVWLFGAYLAVVVAALPWLGAGSSRSWMGAWLVVQVALIAAAATPLLGPWFD